MIDIFITLLIAIILFLLGSVTQAYKKIISILQKITLTIFKIFDRNKYKAERLKPDEIIKDNIQIDIIKKGKIGMKKQKKISIISILVVIIAATLIISNMSFALDGKITEWLILKTGQSIEFISTTYTAVTFSMLSFGLTRTLNSWIQSKDYRSELKRKKLLLKATQQLTSKELLEASKKKELIKMNKGEQ